MKLVKTPVSVSDLSPRHLSLLPRIIPFQRPLKIKELLQKVTEAFGQQMDMYFLEKEVQTRTGDADVSDVTEEAEKQLSLSQRYCGKWCELRVFFSTQLMVPLKTQEDLDQAVTTLGSSPGVNGLLRILLKTPKNNPVSAEDSSTESQSLLCIFKLAA